MRLLRRERDGTLSLTQHFADGSTPPYAIFSHTWGLDTEEVTYRELLDGTGTAKLGYGKIRFCAKQAAADGLDHFWVDTCCIDKADNNELSEAINSMFRWYQRSAKCYVYLSDVATAENGPYDAQLRASRWFSRGWTLQELLAPKSVEFFTRDGLRLGDKTSLERQINEITQIDIDALRGIPLRNFSVGERLNWAETRTTKRDEDWAYCLLGIFGVFMPLIYGEGKEHAIRRLMKEIDEAEAHQSRTALVRDAAKIIWLEPGRHHWVVPFDANKDFVGRDAILHQLLDLIPPRADRHTCQKTAIEGLGGIGKTQIALEAIFRLRKEFPDCSVFWVPAIDAATFEKAYRDIGRRLKIPDIDEEKADVKLLVKTALNESDYDWLLVVDNADDAHLLVGAHPSGSGTSLLLDYLPSSKHGSILFTTRNDAVIRELDLPRSNVICVEEMSRLEAVELLRRSLGASNAAQLADTESTNQLLDFLADLPLAVKQASAYMAKTGMTVPKYLQYCLSSDDGLISLLSKDFADRGRYRTGENAIATTWLISFRHISRDHPLAAEYLQFMSFLAEKDIPMSLLPRGEALEAEEAIGTLLSYAFITKRPEQDAYDMHRLVALTMRNWLAAKGEFNTCVTSVIQRLTEVFPFPEPARKATWEKYLPHVQKSLTFTKDLANKGPISDLLCNVAHSYSALGKYAEAETMFQETVAIQTEALGPEHQITLRTLQSLAASLLDGGKYTEAEALHRKTLMLRTKTLGAQHIETIYSREGVANALCFLGKANAAEAIFREDVQLLTVQVGRKHPATLKAMNNLADALSRQGKISEAEPLFRQACIVITELFGTGHPETLSTRNLHATCLRILGRYPEAEALCRDTFAQQVRALGADHPMTLKNRQLHADILYDQEKYEEASTIYNGILATKIEKLGARHPETLRTKMLVGESLMYLDKCTEAEAVLSETHTCLMERLGSEHPYTLSNRYIFGKLLHGIGKTTQAENLCRETLAIQTRVLGRGHGTTLKNMEVLAWILEDLKNYAEAEQLNKEVVEGTLLFYGTGNYDVGRVQRRLADVLTAQYKYAEGEAVYREALIAMERAFGPEDMRTLGCSERLAFVLFQQGKGVEAEALCRETMARQEIAFGIDDRKTMFTAATLAAGLCRLRKYDESEDLHRRTLLSRREKLGADHTETLFSQNLLARVLRLQGKYAEAERLLRSTLDAQTANSGTSHSNIHFTQSELAAALCGQGRHAESELLLREIIRVEDSLVDKQNLALELAHLEQYEEAVTLYRAVLLQAEALSFIPSGFEVAECRSQLEKVLLIQGLTALEANDAFHLDTSQEESASNDSDEYSAVRTNGKSLRTRSSELGSAPVQLWGKRKRRKAAHDKGPAGS